MCKGPEVQVLVPGGWPGAPVLGGWGSVGGGGCAGHPEPFRGQIPLNLQAPV